MLCYLDLKNGSDVENEYEKVFSKPKCVFYYK